LTVKLLKPDRDFRPSLRYFFLLRAWFVYWALPFPKEVPFSPRPNLRFCTPLAFRFAIGREPIVFKRRVIFNTVEPIECLPQTSSLFVAAFPLQWSSLCNLEHFIVSFSPFLFPPDPGCLVVVSGRFRARFPKKPPILLINCPVPSINARNFFHNLILYDAFLLSSPIFPHSLQWFREGALSGSEVSLFFISAGLANPFRP